MALRVAINGFGRIGRLTLRALYESGRDDIKIVAINSPGSLESHEVLLKYDSAHGRFPCDVTTSGFDLKVNGDKIKVFCHREPENIAWEEAKVDLVMECSGFFNSRDAAAKHLKAGAQAVLISAPAKEADLTVVYGVNHQQLTADHKVVSNASCTTNCLAPVAKVLHDVLGIKHGFMTTVHAYTGDQNLVDASHKKDMRRARAAGVSLVPTSTGAAKAVGLVLPELKGKLHGTSIRVPTPNVSAVDLCFVAQRETTVDEINAAMVKASKGAMKNVLGVCDEPLVSIDFNHDPHSAVFDLTQTEVIDGTFCRVLAWYDNEWGFSNRMLDTAVAMGENL